MKTKSKVWIAVVAALVVVVAVLAGTKVAQIRAMIAAGKSFVPPPESVTSGVVQEVDWQASRSAIGTLVAVRGVTVGAELPGVIRQIGFESGANVRKGDLLVKLDTSTEEAQLAAAVADEQLAKVTLQRAETLRQGGANTQADLEAAQARAKASEATVAGLRATIAKKTIRAPFDGRVAIRQVELGQSVSSGTAIASLQSVTPIFAEFWLPQQALAEVKGGQKVSLRADIYPGATWEGQITTVNPEIDPATRNVRIRATVPNADGRLKPGMFVNVDILSGQRRKALVIPATAVLYAPYGDSVFLVEDRKPGEAAPGAPPAQQGAPPGAPPAQGGLVVKQTFVRLGERQGDYVEVTSGLKAGQRIVSSGAFKLRNGAAVALNDAAAPKLEMKPRPTDQ